VARSGVLPEEREAFWTHCAGVPVIQQEVAAEVGVPPDRVFETLCAKPAKTKTDEIERDVHRTMPAHPKFAKGSPARKVLAQILHCSAVIHPEVGYCQGMNFVVAMLLLSVSAETAFWVWIAMLRNFHLLLLYAPGVPHLPLRLHQFNAVVQKHLPELYSHLERSGYMARMFAHQWVMTLFAYYLDPALLAPTYDLFFLRGWKVVFRLGVTLLRALAPDLQKLDVEGISGLMQASKGQPCHSVFGATVQQVVRTMDAVKITHGELLRFSQAYQCKNFQGMLSSWSSKCASLVSPGFEVVQRASEEGSEAPHRGIAVEFSIFAAAHRPAELLPDPLGIRTSAAGSHPTATKDAKEVDPLLRGPQRVWVPGEVIDALQAELDSRDSVSSQDVALVRGKVTSQERQVIALQKRFGIFKAEHNTCDSQCRDLASRKRTLAADLAAMVPTSIDERGNVSLEMRTLREELSNVESAYFDALAQTKQAARSLEEVEIELAEALEVKQRFIQQMVHFMSEWERLRDELLHTALQRLKHEVPWMPTESTGNTGS